MNRNRQLVTHHEAVPRKRQHKTPCSDCPWARKSLAGWLGGMSAMEWLLLAHGEGKADCHTTIGPQCAGMAIYRANVHKVPRDPSILQGFPQNKVLVFASPQEFLNHHNKVA